jgi:hypothetical protein
MEEILKIVSRMEPEDALAQVGKVLKSLFSILDHETRTRFLFDLIGESQGDKVSSLVHL